MVPGFSFGNAHVGFKVVDGSLYNGPDLVKGYPFFAIPLDTGKNMEIHVFISISGAPFFAVLQGSLQSQTHCPLTICTGEKIYIKEVRKPSKINGLGILTIAYKNILREKIYSEL